MIRQTFLIAAVASAAFSLQAQDITVKGTVFSKIDDEPLIGATVINADKAGQGTATDIDGNFSITVPAGAKLTFSYVGYESQTLKATPDMTVYLDENNALLDELVVVGYQTVRKADLTGAVSVMDMKEPISENSGNIMNSMAGKLPGVNVVPDAAPGGGGSIRVRGMSTANSSNNPLYIVDGVPTEDINSINPSDIESMQVLKDAASASIYGSRAANGVVIITTKHGKGDRLSVNVNYAVSAQTIAKRYQVMDANQWGEALWRASINSGIKPSHPMYGDGPTPVLQPYVEGYPNFPLTNTDWQDEVYHTAWTNNLTASVANNTEKSSVLFSANYINQNGNIIDTFYERFSGRINSRFDINKYVSVGENLLVARSNFRGADVVGDRAIPFTALSQMPGLPVKGLNGDWMDPQQVIGSDLANPVQQIAYTADNKKQTWYILANAFLEVRPIDGLSIKTNFGIEHNQDYYHNLGRALTLNTANSVSDGYNQRDTWTWTNTANYHKNFNQKHDLNVLLGTEAIGYTKRWVDAYRDGYAFTDADYMQIDAGTGNKNNGGNMEQWAVFSLFAKADYNFSDRYLASFTIRRDENSRFAKGHRSGIFPAFSLAWRPTNEEFFPKNEILNDLKIRYSWGQNGNANIPSLYPSYFIYGFSTGNGAYDIAGTNSGTTAGITLISSGNPDLKWETTTQNNIGIDFVFLNGQIALSADYYIKKTTDMLTIPPALDVMGKDAAIWLNTGSMRNNGWELTLAYNSPQYGDFSWNGSVNLSQYKNKLLTLNNRQEFVGGESRLVPGQPMGIYYGYVCDGIFQNVEQVANHATQQGAAPGRLMYRDLNGDGVISDLDRCYIGDPNPDLSMGINLGFKYKSFTLDMFFAGDFGQDIWNAMKNQLYSFGRANTDTNHAADILNAWTPENPGSDIPALSLTDSNNESRFSTYYVQDGSYMKMKYLKIGYTLPQSISRKFACENFNVFAQVENVFTMTKYKGLDPELLPSGYGALVDNGAYPRPRTFTFGINLQF